jgi:hypothetical protein
LASGSVGLSFFNFCNLAFDILTFGNSRIDKIVLTHTSFP